MEEPDWESFRILGIDERQTGLKKMMDLQNAIVEWMKHLSSQSNSTESMEARERWYDRLAENTFRVK